MDIACGKVRGGDHRLHHGEVDHGAFVLPRDADLPQDHVPFRREGGQLILVLCESKNRFYVQEGGGDLVLPLQRNVFEIVRDVEVRDVHVEDALERLLERLAPALERDLLAVHHRGEGRLHVPVDVIREIRQERDADVDPPDLVAGLLRPVVEVDAPVDDLDIIKGKPSYSVFFYPFATYFAEFFYQVGKVVGAVRASHDVHVQPGEPELAEDGPPPDHRSQLEIREDLLGGDPCSRAIALRDRKSPYRDGQLERIYPDVPDRRLPVERFGDVFRKDGFEDGREGEETEEGVYKDGGPRRDQPLPHHGLRPDVLQSLHHGSPTSPHVRSPTTNGYSDSGLAGGFHSATLAIFARSLRFRSTQSLPRSIRRFVEPPAAPYVYVSVFTERSIKRSAPWTGSSSRALRPRSALRAGRTPPSPRGRSPPFPSTP